MARAQILGKTNCSTYYECADRDGNRVAPNGKAEATAEYIEIDHWGIQAGEADNEGRNAHEKTRRSTFTFAQHSQKKSA